MLFENIRVAINNIPKQATKALTIKVLLSIFLREYVGKVSKPDSVSSGQSRHYWSVIFRPWVRETEAAQAEKLSFSYRRKMQVFSYLCNNFYLSAHTLSPSPPFFSSCFCYSVNCLDC